MNENGKHFFVRLTSCYLGINIDDINLENVSGIEEIEKFITDPDSIVLYSFFKKDEYKNFKFSLKINGNECDKYVVFSKYKKSVLRDDNLDSSVQVTCLSGSPGLAMYTSLNLFTPFMLNVAVPGSDDNFQRKLLLLQNDLRSTLLKAGGDDTELPSPSLQDVNSLRNEIEYWKNLANASKNRTSKSSGEVFSALLEPLEKELSLMDVLSLHEIDDALEVVHGVLDDLWHHQLQFPQERMQLIFDSIGVQVIKSLLVHIRKIEIWEDDYNKVVDVLTQSKSIGEHLVVTCRQLTEIFWPNYSSHLWIGDFYVPKDLEQFVSRLDEIIKIRTLHKQLLKLLTPEERDELNTDRIFEPFHCSDVMETFDGNQTTDNSWLKATKQFESALQPAEQKVALKLKKQLAGLNVNIRQLLHEFGRYVELISRPILKQSLLIERQQLLTSLFDYVRSLQTQTSTENSHHLIKNDTPEVVGEVLLIKQLESKALEVQRIGEKLLDDLQGFASLNEIVSELLKNLKQQLTELIDSWTEEITMKIKQNKLSLKESDPVIKFSDDKLMKVNYSPRLVTLVSEVRQLQALGFHVPNHVRQIGEHAKKFMRYAKTLEQIANFHNTFGDRMIASQRPMMLASAVELSKLVQEQEVVSWDDAKAVENYIGTLKGAVDKLSRENNLLASYHYQVTNQIKQLENVDLIKDYSKWKEGSKEIKRILAQVEEKGFRNMTIWKNDIDQKLCRVLEKQYVKSLGTVHLYLPEIHADLVYRKSELKFSPPEEELKDRYDQQLRRFLDIPKNFRGVVEFPEKNIYAGIIEKSSDELSKVDRQTEKLFDELHDVTKHWEAWLQLEPLDVTKLSTWQHWDIHFRASKTFGQEIAKLPSTEEKIGCFLIGLSRLISDLESHNRSYWDQLVQSLKDSIAEDVVKLQNFVDPSTASLTKQPVTIEEIGEAGVFHANILKQLPEMESTFDGMLLKSRTLSGWTREQVDSVNRLKGAWERLQSLLENYQHIISKQIETIKTTLDIESENLNKEFERFGAKWEQVKPRPHSGEISESTMSDLCKQLESIKEKKAQWTELVEKKNKLTAEFGKYGIEEPHFPLSDEIGGDIEKEEKNWALFEEFREEIENLAREEWIVFRKKIYLFEEAVSKWRTRLKDVEQTDHVIRILQELNRYEEVAPVLKYVRGEDFTDKHWTDVSDTLGIVLKPTELRFGDFLAVSEKLVSCSQELLTVCRKAASEVIVRQALAELDQWDVQARFTLLPHANSQNKQMQLIKEFKEVLSKIGDNQSLLQSVKNCADYESFSERAAIWENKLIDLDSFVSSLAQIQRKWLYLEPIFGSGTLIQEKSRFEKLDKEFRHVLLYIEKDPRVSVLCRYPNLRSLLENVQNQLARCQNSLDNFLTEKRNKFPRFLFLNDDDLLEVVGQSSKEQVIQTHLKKLFAGISGIQLDGAGRNITGMCSSHGEAVPLSNPVNIERPVEDWLNSLVKEMQITLKDLLVHCRDNGELTDPLNYPSQILCLIDGINFTTKCEQAIANMTLPPLLATYKAQLTHYSSLELNGDDEKLLSSLNVTASDDEEMNVLELKLQALLLDTIHHISVVEELLDQNVTKTSDWIWQKQLRFYANSTGEVTVKMANARMDYAYEYLGNAPKLVRTPLTDKCFLTLTQGLHLGMGGNPYGPAGTGKTESIKALGGLLGRQVLVFNCDEGIDASSMGRILCGLVKSGAWGCFDEFNRLDEATLSAISMYIHPIQISLRTGKSSVKLFDQEVPVNRHCGIFVTLNPAGGGYGGRNRLPDNLKQLFRPVVMTHPDHEEIAKCLLHCDGYQNASYIARKLVEVFDLSGELLSKQQHYDWGLRALRTVLIGCGRAMKVHRKRPETTGSNILDTELKLVVRTLRINTLSKLTFKDGVAFDGLIGDVFKGIPLEDVGNNVLIEALESSFVEMNLTINKRQIQKCLELYEQLKQRMGIAIVGPPRSGKSTVRNLLFHALIKMGRSVKKTSLNPKSMSKVQLLGEVDASTRQWNDGVLTVYSLQIASEPTSVWSWMVCDGNVDPEWVESLNSVLDDNRLLTLPSGWRIQFGPNVNFLFETHDLSHASPATISRMGIVFLSDADMSVGDYVANYVRNYLPEGSGVLDTLVEEYFFKALDYAVKENMTTRSQIALSDTVLSQMFDVRSKSQFTVRLVNGFCCQIAQHFRADLTQKIFDSLNEPAPPTTTNIRYNEDRDTIESHFTNPNVTFDDSELPLLPTGQILNVLETLSFWLERNGQHFVIVGDHGSAKTLLLRHLAREPAELDMTTIYCNGNLKPEFIITKMSQNCILVHTNKGKVYRPKKGRLVLHMKNLHLLKPDKWGTNILIEFLHQIITYKGFYDSNLEFIGLENVTIAGSAETLSDLSPRFTSLVHILHINPPEQDDLSLLVVSYLSLMLRKLAPDVTWPKAKITKLAASMISVYEKTKNAFAASVNFKCFDSHDLIKWCSGILYYQADVESNEMEPFIIEIVRNEALKLFCDKLDKEEDVARFRQIIDEVFAHHWGKSNATKSIENFYYVPQHQQTSPKLQKLNHQDWYNLIQKGITLCEREGRTLDVIVNNELMDLSASISRAAARENGNLVLIGRSGVGRKSSVRIVAALQSAKLIALTSDQKIQFNNDLKSALQYSGLEGDDQQVYLLLEDHALSRENILSVLNTLIFSGEAPGLYSPVEIDSLVAGLKEEAARHNFEGNLFDFFAQRVRKNLHVILCLDVDNEDLTSVFESCPALYRNCGVVWKYSWSRTTLEGIPRIIIDRINETNRGVREIRHCDDFLRIFQEIESKSAAPFRFVAMVKLYCEIYSDKFGSIAANQNKLQAGVSKLTEAHNLVTSLKEEAASQQKKLAEKQSKANNALDMITNTMKNANSHKEEMESLKQITEHENVKIMKRKQEIDEELSEVEPLIQEARSAVGNIKPESLSEIRSLRAPPDVIRDILEGVLRLMGIQDTSWNSMKTFLAKRGVKEEIRSFDAGKIAPESRQAVERLMATKKDSFDPRAAKRASVAAAPLASWVSANVKYSLVMDKIRPLEREQSKLQKNLVQAENQLGELSAGLLDVDATVSQLKAQLSAYTKEAAEIEIGLNRAQEMLASAEGLVSKLQDEYRRWQEQLKELSAEIEHLPINCLLASAYVTYLSNESEEGRRTILNKWLQALKSPGFDIKEFLSSERQELQWQSEGLSRDNVSLQNAIIILKTNIIPLLIDPTSMAVDWIKNDLKSRQFEKIAQSSNKFNTALELAIRFGKTLIIEEVEDISPVLLPILRKEIAYQGERKLISLQGKQIDYHQDFRVILCSRNEQLRLKPNEEAVIAVMNFTVTRSGLTEQLLNGAVRQEKPELETRQKQLLSENEELREKQHNLQNQLLEDLANSKGNILQNAGLLKSLNEAKASSVSIAAALEELVRVQGKLQQEYDVYRDVAAFAGDLYFAVNEFSKLNILYVTSVPACTRLFLKSLQTFQAVDSKATLYKKYLLQTFYNFTSRGIFKDDRVKFALHLVQKMFPDEVPSNEWNIFLGSYLSNVDDFEDTPLWIPEQRRPYVQKLQMLPDLYGALKLNEQAAWSKFMTAKDCELHFPAHCKVTEFQKVILVQALRPDRLYSSISRCILQLTGLKNLEPAVTELSSVWKESVPKEPILLLITSGNDPSSAIISIAQSQMGIDQYKEIAMGEGQEDFAIETLRQCADTGKWLILKNLHLVRKWLPLLCQKIQSVQPKPSFRLWLITEPHDEFNFVLAQNSLKIAYESPQGVKNNLLHTYAARGGKYFEKLSPNAARIFFVMSCVHALLQERRTYIPQGWSKWYEFSDTDFATLIDLIEDLWQGGPTARTQWRFMAGLHSDAVYGGRIERTGDLEVLRAYLRRYCADEVLSHRWRPFDLAVNLPTTSKYQDYMNVIVQLPGRDSPAYFGLPENIGSALEKQMSTNLIENLKNLHHLSKTVTSKFDRELWYKGLSPLINLWKKINQGRDFVRMTFADERRKGSPIETFFVEEFKWAVELTQLVHGTFSSLNRICKSSLPPDENRLIDGRALMNYQVPKSWRVVWDGPKDPSRYIITVVDKTEKLSKWYEQDVREILRDALNLSHIFHPEAFLASHKQEHSRTSNIPIDRLVLSTTWRARPSERSSVSVTNLFVEGGIFDGSDLKPCATGTENLNPAPDCFISWRERNDTESAEEEKMTRVPLFYSPLREKQLASLQVPCRAADRDQWVLAGLAFYLEH